MAAGKHQHKEREIGSRRLIVHVYDCGRDVELKPILNDGHMNVDEA